MRCCRWSYLRVRILRHKVNYIRGIKSIIWEQRCKLPDFDTIYCSLYGWKMGLTGENRNLSPSFDGPLNLRPRRSTILSPTDQLPWFELHGFSIFFLGRGVLNLGMPPPGASTMIYVILFRLRFVYLLQLASVLTTQKWTHDTQFFASLGRELVESSISIVSL